MKDIIQKLKEENDDLRLRIRSLEQKVAFFENNPELSEAIRLETTIAEAVGGSVTGVTVDHDVIIETSQLKFEVKFARLHAPVRTSRSRRWCWGKPLGYGGRKIYDRLILIGEADPRFSDDYLENESPYVIFDIPYDAVPSLCTKTGDHNNIYLIANPKSSRSVTAVLFRDYQTSVKALKARYRILPNKSAQAIP